MSAFPEDGSALDAWAAQHVEGYAGPSKAFKYPTGQSNPTYRIETPTKAYVLRCKPPGKLLKSANMVEREFRVLRARETAGFPAPKALALCEDVSVAGSVFYLMAHVEGRILWDPGLAESNRAERAGVYDSMNQGLAQLHLIDVAAAGLADFGKPGNYFARQTQRWAEQYRLSETETIPEMDRLIEWLSANMPPDVLGHACRLPIGGRRYPAGAVNRLSTCWRWAGAGLAEDRLAHLQGGGGLRVGPVQRAQRLLWVGLGDRHPVVAHATLEGGERRGADRAAGA